MANYSINVTRDAFIVGPTTSTNWSIVRNAINGSSVGNAAASSNNGVASYKNISTSRFFIARAFFIFDTSTITTAVSSATLNVYGVNTNNINVIAVKLDSSVSVGDLDNDFVVADYDAIDGFVAGSTMLGNVTAYSQANSWSLGAFNTLTLGAAARTDIQNNNSFGIVLVSSDYDYPNTAPPNSTFRAGMNFLESGDPFIPYLSVVAEDAVSEEDELTRRRRIARRRFGISGTGFNELEIASSSGLAIPRGFKQN